jgi:hypothetical protein
MPQPTHEGAGWGSVMNRKTLRQIKNGAAADVMAGSKPDYLESLIRSLIVAEVGSAGRGLEAVGNDHFLSVHDLPVDTDTGYSHLDRGFVSLW